jgi:hypothetical protein
MSAPIPAPATPPVAVYSFKLTYSDEAVAVVRDPATGEPVQPLQTEPAVFKVGDDFVAHTSFKPLLEKIVEEAPVNNPHPLIIEVQRVLANHQRTRIRNARELYTPEG